MHPGALPRWDAATKPNAPPSVQARVWSSCACALCVCASLLPFPLPPSSFSLLPSPFSRRPTSFVARSLDHNIPIPSRLIHPSPATHTMRSPPLPPQQQCPLSLCLSASRQTSSPNLAGNKLARGTRHSQVPAAADQRSFAGRVLSPAQDHHTRGTNPRHEPATHLSLPLQMRNPCPASFPIVPVDNQAP